MSNVWLPVRSRQKNRLALAWLAIIGLLAGLVSSVGTRAATAGEPAEAFLAQLRSQGYFDMAIAYLDRLDRYPGVDPELLKARSLERAQTYIDAAVASTDANKRDQNFVEAEKQLREFTKQESHPRIPEARAQLGRLQMVRASQLMAGAPDDAQRKAARESYLEAAKTFDAILAQLTSRLEEMQGQRIDDSKDPAAAARRDRYRAEFLQAKFDAAETRRLAAETFTDPAQDATELLDDCIAKFTDLYDKYGQKYPLGASALYYIGRCHESLGRNQEALDQYLSMLDQVEADPLREAKFLALSGAIRIWLAQSPPNHSQSITRGAELMKSVRRNEQHLASVQELRLTLGQAYLAKSNDQDANDRKRALTEGRSLLVAASKLPGPHVTQVNQLLAALGIDNTQVELPTAEPPKSLDDALEKARQLLTVTENLQQSLAVLKKQGQASGDIEQQKQDIEKQLQQSRGVGVLILRGGLAMVSRGADLEKVNQARQLMTYMLYQEERYRDAAAVGQFLARTSPGTEVGLRGGLLALNSLQLLLAEVPESENAGLVDQVDRLGKFLTQTWPDNPDAKAAQGVMIRLALSKDRWDEARQMIDQIPAGPEQARFRRLLGQLVYNQAVVAARGDEPSDVTQWLTQAREDLTKGLAAISGKLADAEAMQAALILSKIYLKQDESRAAIEVLDHPDYGPLKLVKTLGAPSDRFEGDLYSTELQVLVQRMIAADQDPAALLDRATRTMENLRKSFSGPDGQARLTSTYLRMASDIRDQLDSAPPARKEKLIAAFRVFLGRIAQTTRDPDTLAWVGQTLMQMGESAMLATDTKAAGQAAELIQSAVETFENLLDKRDEKPLALQFQLARAQRLLGNYKPAIDTLAVILAEKPMMLDAQTEAALAYQSWAGQLDPKFAPKAYESALSGARPGADGTNVIWGWGKISQLTSSREEFRDRFFEARYHVALCRFLMGKSLGNQQVMQKAITDITKVAALYPDLGGEELRNKYDRLLKEVQRAVGEKADGLPPLARPGAA